MHIFVNPTEAMKLSVSLIDRVSFELGLDISNLEKREKICLICWELHNLKN